MIKGWSKDHQGIIKGSSALTFCRFIWNSFSASCSSIASGIVKASAAAMPAAALSAPPLLYSPFCFSGVNVANSGTVLRAAGERLLENMKKKIFFKFGCHEKYWSLKLDFHSVLFVARSTFCDSFLLNCEPSTGTDAVEGSQFKRKRSQKVDSATKSTEWKPALKHDASNVSV